MPLGSPIIGDMNSPVTEIFSDSDTHTSPGTARKLDAANLTNVTGNNCLALVLQADPANGKPIAVGGSAVKASEAKGTTKGTFLNPGAEITIITTLVTNIYWDVITSGDYLLVNVYR